MGGGARLSPGVVALGFLHQYTAYDKSFNYETLVRYAQPYLTKANDLFLRNLQALREMKSSPITIKIEQAGQVNVGEKQLNVASNCNSQGDSACDHRVIRG